MNKTQILQKLAEIDAIKSKLLDKLATIDAAYWAKLKPEIVKHLVANRVPAKNAEEFVTKRLVQQLSLNPLPEGNLLLSGNVSVGKNAQKLGHVVKMSLEGACKDLKIQCGVVVNIG